jgi:hypothetical protein
MSKIVVSKERVKCRGDRLSRIWWQGKQWAVTSFGIERRDGLYVIEKARLGKDHDGQPGWLLHMAGKGIDFDDFATAYLVGLALHGYGDWFSPECIRDTLDRCHSRRKQNAAFAKFVDKHEPAKNGFRICPPRDLVNSGIPLQQVLRDRANCGATGYGTYRSSVTTVATRRRSFLRATEVTKPLFRNNRSSRASRDK